MAASRHDDKRCTRQCRKESGVRWRRAKSRVTVVTGPSRSTARCQRLLGGPSNASSFIISGPLPGVTPFHTHAGAKADATPRTHTQTRTLKHSVHSAPSQSTTYRSPLSQAGYVPYLPYLTFVAKPNFARISNHRHLPEQSGLAHRSLALRPLNSFGITLYPNPLVPSLRQLSFVNERGGRCNNPHFNFDGEKRQARVPPPYDTLGDKQARTPPAAHNAASDLSARFLKPSARSAVIFRFFGDLNQCGLPLHFSSAPSLLTTLQVHSPDWLKAEIVAPLALTLEAKHKKQEKINFLSRLLPSFPSLALSIILSSILTLAQKFFFHIELPLALFHQTSIYPSIAHERF